MKKIFMPEIFVVLKLRAFYFEISTFSSPGCCIHIAFTTAGRWYQQHGSVLQLHI